MGMGMRTSRPFSETRNALLQDRELAALYVDVALAGGDIAAIKLALKHVAQSREGGVAALARKCELSRNQLYRSLSPKGTLRLDTLRKVLRALGLRITVLSQEQSDNARL